MRLFFWAVCLFLLFMACTEKAAQPQVLIPESPFLVVLGIAQDAGYPQMGCEKTCCTAVWTGQEDPQFVSSIGLVDPSAQKKWLFDATPDMREQLELFQQYALSQAFLPDGIFLTHAHMGHYTGLMQLGREVMGADRVPVWAMPRMDTFLRKNGPWGQLVHLQNMEIQALSNKTTVPLSETIQVQPIQVPHRDEYSETVGFLISGPNKSALFIPDIDKWERWDESIVDYAEKV
ncbi:MAG: MBL fold metallo-hydrolase, partial [Bacteroidota bacterium]